MKILVKTDKGLRKLGEGRIFSKSQLRLVEETTDNSTLGTDVGSTTGKPLELDATNGQDASSANIVAKNVGNMSAKTSSIPNKVAALDMGDVEWESTPNINKNEPGADVGITAQGGTEQDIRNAVTQAKQVRAGRVLIPMESVASKNTMDEMRRNSIPFTKRELSKFLSEL